VWLRPVVSRLTLAAAVSRILGEVGLNPRVDVSWIFWPGRDDEKGIEFARLLASAQDGGATIAECLQASGRIVEGDDASWHREWQRLACASAQRAEVAHAAGCDVTAGKNWLRAVNYYLASIHLFDAAGCPCLAVVEAMRKCAESYLRHATPGGEIVSIPWLRSRPLQGYLLRPAGRRSASPVVVCMGEPGHRKEEYLVKLARHAGERGLALFALDFRGEGNADCGVELIGDHGIESVLSTVLDHLVERDDIDASRMAVLADCWGSSFVARGVGAEQHRIAATVCDGGLWDFHERCFLAGRASGGEVDAASEPFASRVARNIECPLLITLGERGWLQAGRAGEFVDRLQSSGRDVTLKIFTSAETAAEQGHADNPTLANEFIFDWLRTRLESPRPNRRASAQRVRYRGRS
jgi:dienelactone hydrolase